MKATYFTLAKRFLRLMEMMFEGKVQLFIKEEMIWDIILDVFETEEGKLNLVTIILVNLIYQRLDQNHKLSNIW